MPPDVPAELRTLEWLPPWEPTESELAAELAREVGPGHPLFGRPAVAVGRRADRDDVLFWLPAGPTALAVVHLTWGRRRERSTGWPAVELYASVAEWCERMRVDHAESEPTGPEGPGGLGAPGT